MYWMTLPLKRYAEFSGRSRRREYWMFLLGSWLVAAVFVVALHVVGVFDSKGQRAAIDWADVSIMGWAVLMSAALCLLALLVPMLAVQVRRLHDQDKSGWALLLTFIPYIGTLVLFFYMAAPGTLGRNRFGADPRSGLIVGPDEPGRMPRRPDLG